MITLPVSAAEAILTALLNRPVTLDWLSDNLETAVRDLAPKKRGRKPGGKNKPKIAKSGKRKYTKKSKYWSK
jgi:hypothetical protein